jgi:hypothetical protein
VIRGNNGTKEGVTQGDPISMVAYGVGILPLIRVLKQEFPEVEQLLYAYDAGTGGKCGSIRRQITKLQEIGPNYGYFPERSKKVLDVPSTTLKLSRLPLRLCVYEYIQLQRTHD